MLKHYINIIRKTIGITLIALVVTIIVLLILAGITISLVFGPNGVVKKAQEAANKTNEAIINEQAQMNGVTSTIENMLNGIGGGSTTPEEPLPEGAVQFSPVKWENGQASTTITTSEEGYTLQYQIGGITEENWIETTSGYEITGLTLGQTVYGRLFNGTEGSKTADITVEDLDAPSASWLFTDTNVTTGARVAATIVQTDAESGLNITECRYVLNTISDEIGTDSSLYTGGSFNGNIEDITLNTQELHLTMDTAGTFYLHILTVDNAGNKVESISKAITVTQPLPADGSFSETEGVNTPKLGNGMTPIKWDDNAKDWVETDGSDPDWYDYSAKEWANVKTSDGSMWVWIPRYAYSITSGYHSSTAGTIEVEFMKGLTNETSTGRTTFQNASGAGNWNIHPAFNYGETVSGIWVAKFEASQSDASSSSMGSSGIIKAQPGVQSWRELSVNDIYTNCLNYNKTLNSHMMKNDEWGAVAYLSKSKYGKETEEVWINNSSSFITGSAGDSASAEKDVGTTNDYTSTQGVKASTTGNVWGVYDMSGGAYEYVAAYVNNGNSSLTSYGSSLVNGDAKTKNVYSQTGTDSKINNYNTNAGEYGDAIYETSTRGEGETSWYNDLSGFPNTSSSFFTRGGYYENDFHAGIFVFNGSNGQRRFYWWSYLIPSGFSCNLTGDCIIPRICTPHRPNTLSPYLPNKTW